MKLETLHNKMLETEVLIDSDGKSITKTKAKSLLKFVDTIDSKFVEEKEFVIPIVPPQSFYASSEDIDRYVLPDGKELEDIYTRRRDMYILKQEHPKTIGLRQKGEIYDLVAINKLATTLYSIGKLLAQKKDIADGIQNFEIGLGLFNQVFQNMENFKDIIPNKLLPLSKEVAINGKNAREEIDAEVARLQTELENYGIKLKPLEYDYGQIVIVADGENY